MALTYSKIQMLNLLPSSTPSHFSKALLSQLSKLDFDQKSLLHFSPVTKVSYWEMSYSTSVHLRPVWQKRKKRPSYGPLKTAPPASATPRRAATASPEKKSPEKDGLDLGFEGANLVFDEFSFVDENGEFDSILKQHMDALLDYLGPKYGVTEILDSGIFLILTCKDEVPPSDQRPFLIAGRIGVWARKQDPLPMDLLLPQQANGDDLEVPEHLARDLKAYSISTSETLDELWDTYFSDALQIQYYVTGIVVELPEVSPEAHYRRMEKLPNSFTNATATLGFMNGLRPLTKLARQKKPMPSAWVEM
jgi:hypothetical protein